MDIWFIADLHFGHENILKYEYRPFYCVKEMDEILIQNWNSLVKPNDYIMILGDFALTNSERIRYLVSILNGKKELILGNHDRSKSINYWKKAGFINAYKEPQEGINYILSHEPIVNTKKFNVHGHVHSHIENWEGRYPELYKCVSVEVTDYKPVHIDEILKKM